MRRGLMNPFKLLSFKTGGVSVACAPVPTTVPTPMHVAFVEAEG